MRLFTSNRLEALLDALAGVLRQAPLPPLQAEIIVVQSRGMERWLSLQLAERLGVWANAAFPFPGKLAWQMFRQALPGQVPDTSAYDAAVLAWVLLRLLPQQLDDPAFTELAHYLAEDDNPLKRWQLARRIGQLFDQYVIYRPDWILNWDAGEEEHWQAKLWRALREDYRQRGEAEPAQPPQSHRADVLRRFLMALEAADFDAGRLPRRINVFGISALPPFYIQVLAALGRHTEVNLFIMNPCAEYWGDIVSDTELSRLLTRRPDDGLGADELYYQRGNSLLAGMGKLGRDFLDLLSEAEAETYLEGFVEPEADTLLHCLQNDVLHLQETGQQEDVPPHVWQALDDSLQIHSCHSPLREVEVLHDRLLALLQRYPQLQAHDVLVMAPDIEQYAPFIQAVFATTPRAGQRIPFSIADRSLHHDSQLIDSFLGLLDLAQARMGLSEVLDVLETEPVQRRFRLSLNDLEQIQYWLTRAGVRWGIDAHSRDELELPAFAENSWHFGLERLLLGYALPDESALFQGVLPLDQLEGSQAEIFGRLLDFTGKLFALREQLRGEQPPAAWQALLNQIVDDFFELEREQQPELLQLRQTLARLSTESVAADFAAPLPLAVIRHWLEQALAQEDSPLGFISGQVTFCSMLPMRSIPFQVICLLGMNDSAYPRSHRPPGFDLMSQQPRRGDRSRRNDDRYLFLESLLSARQHFYLSYVGQSIQDNSALPPSVLVTELLDYVAAACVGPDGERGEDLLARLHVRHPLQAFSPRYFQPEPNQAATPPVNALFSYAQEYSQAGRILAAEPQPQTPFLSQPLPEPGEEWQNLDLEQLIRFFRNPAAFWLEARLGLRLERLYSDIEDEEPLDLQGLARYQVEAHLLERGLAGEDWESAYPLLRAAGALPPQQLGQVLYTQTSNALQPFVKELGEVLDTQRLEPLSARLELDGVSLHGQLPRLWPAAQIDYRFAALKAKDRLSLWLRHLFLNALEPPADYPRESWFIAKDGRLSLTPPGAESRKYLSDLIAIFQTGLRRPLPFFPTSAWVYVEALDKGKASEEALRMANKSWLGSDFHAGEKPADPALSLCFRAQDRLDAEFAELATRIMQPLQQWTAAGGEN